MLLRKGIILLYLIAITYCNTVIIGQNTYINYPASETDTTHNNSDTTRILDYLYASISEVGIINNEEYLNKARLLAEEKNKLDFLADRADSLGVTERNRGNYSKAIRLHQLALEISELTGNKQYASIFNNNLGVVYRRIDEYDKAMKYHHKALKLAELIDNTRSKSIAINSLGNIQMIIGNNDEAHEYFKQSLKLEEDAGNLLGIAINLNNIGNIYFHDKDYNKAKEYYQKSLKINKSINSLRGIGICYSDLGAVYEDEGNYKESLIYYNKALSVNLQHGDKIYLSDNYIHLGILNYKLGELKKAENFFTKGLRIAKKIGAKEVIKDAHNGLYKINYDRRKYKNAILHSDTFHIYKDSIMSSNLRKEIARLKISYDSERKESLISSLEQRSKIDQLEIKRQKNIFLLTLSGFIIALISISFLVIYIRYKSKSTRILQRKNEEIDRARYNLKKLADDLYIAKQKAEQSDKIKSEFLANMSHEIRTPLNGVIGFTDLLEKNISDPGLLKYLKSIKVSSNILLTLINDILDLSKIEAGKIYVKYRALNIRDLCYELEQIFESKSNDNNNTLEFNISNSTPILINFSDLRLRQILLNLISNAIKFTRNGNIDISFHAKNKRVGKTDILIEIKDNGIGIPPEEQKNIFKPFYQMKSSKYNEGTGLGLAIVGKLVEVLDGSIELSSIVGKGSCFKLTFKDIEVLTPDILYMNKESKDPLKNQENFNTKNKKSNNLFGYSLKDLKVNKEVKSSLYNIYNNEFKKAKSTNLFDNFKLFRKSVYELALKLDDKSLLAYSNELSVLIEHFDIEGIENYLNEFEEKLGGLFKDE